MGTMSDPEVGSGPESSGTGTAGEIAIDVAWLVAQVMVVVWPLFTSVGLALKVVICGTIGGGPAGLLLPMLHPRSGQKLSSAMPKTALRRYV